MTIWELIALAKAGDGGAKSMLHFKGSVLNESALPESGNDGDTYLVDSADSYFAWDGEGWTDVGQLLSMDDVAALFDQVEDAGDAQVARIVAKGQEVEKSIPKDYSELSGDVDNLKSAIDNLVDVNSYEKSGSGNIWIAYAIISGHKYRLTNTSPSGACSVSSTNTYGSVSENIQTFSTGLAYNRTMTVTATADADYFVIYFNTNEQTNSIVIEDVSLRVPALELRMNEAETNIDILETDVSHMQAVTVTMIDDVYINKTSGDQETSTGYSSCDYLPVKGSVWLFTIGNDDNSGYAFYDEGKNAVSYDGIYNISGTWTEITVPENAKYFRASCVKSQKSLFDIRINVSNNAILLNRDDYAESLRGIHYDAGYVINTEGKIGAFTASESYYSKILPVKTGEVYYIFGAGAVSARLWSTHGIDGTTMRIADSGAYSVKNGVKITIAPDETYLVFNTAVAATTYGIVSGAASMSTANTRSLLKEIFDRDLYEVSCTFRNNMSTDGADKLPSCKITRNGTSSPANYGLSGSSYEFEMPRKKTHIYFEYRQTEPVESSLQSSVNKFLLSAYNAGWIGLNFSGSYFTDAELFQRITLICGSVTNRDDLLLMNERYNRMQGQDAFFVQYTNQVGADSVCTIAFGSSGITVNVDGVESSVACTAATSLADVIAALNGISGISAVPIIQAGKTYGDLLPVVAPCSTTINLIYSGTYHDSQTYKDNPPIYIPLALDETWHSVEAVIDPTEGIFAAIDGITRNPTTGSSTRSNKLTINSSNMPIVLRNLIIDYGTAADAELIDNLVDPSISTPMKQLISNHNPHLLIYEGHGVDVCMDADAPLSDNMACSTERLRIVFEAAQAKGYVPVTWQDIIKWKKMEGTLPKRCYTIMFDDWRFANYVDYDKRKPFVDFCVKPGLAVITSDTAYSGTVSINGKTYNVADVVDMTMKAGWYPSSHTHDHRYMTAYKPSEAASLLKTDVLEANDYHIYSDVITYPYGDITRAFMPQIRHSDFAIGVVTVTEYYNCKGTSDFYLSRVEIGTRTSLSNSLYPLV